MEEEKSKLNIFICWSGKRSEYIGQVIYDWFPKIFQSVKIWYSRKNIPKGKPWFDYIRKTLEETDIGIVCLTPENINNKWILFESGAIQKKVKEGRVFTLLYDYEKADLDYPLAGFQHTKFEKTDFFQLVKDINVLLRKDKLKPNDIEYFFENAWKNIEVEMKKIPKPEKDLPKPEKPEIEDKLNEILMTLRDNQSSNFEKISHQDTLESILNRYPDLTSIQDSEKNYYMNMTKYYKKFLDSRTPRDIEIYNIIVEMLEVFPMGYNITDITKEVQKRIKNSTKTEVRKSLDELMEYDIVDANQGKKQIIYFLHNITYENRLMGLLRNKEFHDSD